MNEVAPRRLASQFGLLFKRRSAFHSMTLLLSRATCSGLAIGPKILRFRPLLAIGAASAPVVIQPMSAAGRLPGLNSS